MAVLVAVGSLKTMTLRQPNELRWPFRRRLLHATLGGLSHAVGQLFYRVTEYGASMFGRRAFRDEQRAVRRSAHLYWVAQRHDRQGRTDEALRVAKEAFAVLKEADPKETFSQMGYATASLVDDLAEQLGQPDAARAELQEALKVFREMQAASPGKSSALDRVVAWLEYRTSQSS